MKKVLIVAYYFPPLGGGGTLRTVKFVKYLQEFGWEPVVLTVNAPHYLVEDPWLESQLPPNLAVFRSKAFLPGRFFRKTLNHSYTDTVDRRKPVFKRVGKCVFQFGKNLVYTFAFTPDEYVGWIPFAVKAGLRIIEREKIDALYTTAPPNSLHLIGRKLHQKTGLPWVADFRDLWNQYPESYNPFGWKWKARLDNWFEKQVLETCQKAIAVSETMKQEILGKYHNLPEKKLAVITNGFDLADSEGLSPDPIAQGKFLVTHAGTLFAWRKASGFWRVLRKMLDQNAEFARHFRLLLLGIVHADVQAEIRRLGLTPWVDIQGYKNYPEMVRILKRSDVLLLIIGNQPHAANVLTLKLFDYLNARRPILALAPEGEVSRMVRNYHLGKSCLPEDLPGVEKALRHFFSAWQENRLSWPVQGDLSPFHRSQLTAQLAAMLDEVVTC